MNPSFRQNTRIVIRSRIGSLREVNGARFAMPMNRDELRWLMQADRARRLAATLPADDARVLETFARECEARAHIVAMPEAARAA